MEPQLIARLVALNERTRQAWAHPHNKAFYKPASFRGFSVQNRRSRLPTPKDEDFVDNHHAQDTEPELRLYLNTRPKDISKGWVFGSDENVCDIYCGEHSESEEYNISKQTFSITINKQLQVILRHLRNINRTQVQYGSQKAGDRQAFVWIMFPAPDGIIVTSARQLVFKVLVTDPDEQTELCRTLHLQRRSRFLRDVERSTPSMPLLDKGPKPQPFYYVCEDRVLGRGSFGQVYIVVDVSTGAEYAGKTFLGEFDQNEADILSKQNHANILRYITLSNDDGPLLVTEYLKEGNLARPWEAKDRGPWQVDQIVRILTQCLRGLATLHAGPNPAIHRDIKPQNILVADQKRGSEPNERGPWVKIADFGVSTQGTKCEGQSGTWIYSAPEVFSSVRCTSKVDIWSLGVVILQLLLEGNIPEPSHHVQGVEWCKDIYTMANENAFSCHDEDCDEFGRNEYSLETFLWAFIKCFMLQGDPKKRLSAQECLRHPLFLQMQSASRYAGGWQVRTQESNEEGGLSYTMVSITKKFAPKAAVPLPGLGGGAQNGKATRATYDPGVKMSVALMARKAQESRRSAKSKREVPQPIGFGLICDAYLSRYSGASSYGR